MCLGASHVSESLNKAYHLNSRYLGLRRKESSAAVLPAVVLGGGVERGLPPGGVQVGGLKRVGRHRLEGLRVVDPREEQPQHPLAVVPRQIADVDALLISRDWRKPCLAYSLTDCSLSCTSRFSFLFSSSK